MGTDLSKDVIYGTVASGFDQGLGEVQEAFRDFANRERDFKQSRRLFVKSLYEFAQANQGDEETLNATINERGLQMKPGANSWQKFARLAMATERDGVWEKPVASQESKYATIMSGAAALDMPADTVLTMLEEWTFERSLGQLRSVLNHEAISGDFAEFLNAQQIIYENTEDEDEEDNDSDAELQNLLTKGAASLNQPFEVDLASLGVKEGPVELVGEVGIDGKLRIKAVLQTERKKAQKLLETALEQQKPLERKFGDLIKEIQRFNFTGDAVANIVSNGNGVDVSIIDRAVVKVVSSQQDLSFNGKIDCLVPVRELSRIKKVRELLDTDEMTLLSRKGQLILQAYPQGGKSVDEAVSAKNAGKAKKLPVPEYLESKSDKSNRHFGRVVFTKLDIEVKPVAVEPSNVTLIDRNDIPQILAETDNAGEFNSISLKGNVVSIVEGDTIVSMDDLALSLKQLKALVEGDLEFSVEDYGVDIKGAKRDYSWRVILPVMKDGKAILDGIA